MHNSDTSGDIWSSSKRIAFRFFFTYFSLFIVLVNNGAFPFYNYIQSFIDKGLFSIIPWIGKYILGIGYTIKTGPNGSGDTTYDYVLIFTICCIAVISTIIWSLLDVKYKNYKRLYYWLSLGIRCYVALMLINYGMVKVIQLQFSSPNMYRLTQNYGDSSPMGLAWTFLGFSKGYNLFMGIAEIAAVLLLFRRTLVFGLIITLMTTANVMAVNYFYDVPVKILSTHLVLMTAFLLAHSFVILCNFFFLRKPVSLTDIYKPIRNKKTIKTLIVCKVLLLVYVLGYGAYDTIQTKEKYRGVASKSFLRGLYEVHDFTVNNDNYSVDSATVTPWKYLMIDNKRYVRVQYRDGNRDVFLFTVDSLKKKLTLKDPRDSTKFYNFDYKEKDSLSYDFIGSSKTDTLAIKTKRYTNYKEKFLLTNREFHWINEYPLNR